MSNILLHGFLGSDAGRDNTGLLCKSNANPERTYALPQLRSAKDAFEWEAITAIMKQRAGKTRGLDEERNRLARDSCTSRNYIKRTHSGNRSPNTLPPVKDKAMLLYNCQRVYKPAIQQFNQIKYALV
jgi:hypothetical protein